MYNMMQEREGNLENLICFRSHKLNSWYTLICLHNIPININKSDIRDWKWSEWVVQQNNSVNIPQGNSITFCSFGSYIATNKKEIIMIRWWFFLMLYEWICWLRLLNPMWLICTLLSSSSGFFVGYFVC